MIIKHILLFIGCFPSSIFAQDLNQQRKNIDPRAIGVKVVRFAVEKSEPYRERRLESTYSIVIYGHNALLSSSPKYYIRGMDRDLNFEELKNVLTKFYDSFPIKAERLGNGIPLPNIMYYHYGWTERSHDGPELVDSLSKQYGVGLYYFQQNSYHLKMEAFPKTESPSFEQVCWDYYLERLQDAFQQTVKLEEKTIK